MSPDEETVADRCARLCRGEEAANRAAYGSQAANEHFAREMKLAREALARGEAAELEAALRAKPFSRTNHPRTASEAEELRLREARLARNVYDGAAAGQAGRLWPEAEAGLKRAEEMISLAEGRRHSETDELLAFLIEEAGMIEKGVLVLADELTPVLRAGALQEPLNDDPAANPSATTPLNQRLLELGIRLRSNRQALSRVRGAVRL